MAERRQFTPEFKRQAVELLNAGQRPTAEIARELGIARNQLYKWQTELRARGNETFSVRHAQRAPTEIARLKRELLDLSLSLNLPERSYGKSLKSSSVD